jgi:hypothetical protein
MLKKIILKELMIKLLKKRPTVENFALIPQEDPQILHLINQMKKF